MGQYREVPVPAGGTADFAVTLTDDSLLPWVKPGETVYLRRRTDLRDGDVGLFYTAGGMAFRQFCRDSQGNVYLFAVNRRYRWQDLSVPAERTGEIVCYGRAELAAPIPLPMD